MTIPVLLVTGFLGAGKTTFINALLESGLCKVAAIVNDFGAINIDAEIIEGRADAVVGLGNGCICCSLQGDLLRSLKQVLAHDPEAIVIEASGVADPRGIIETLADPILWNEIRLDVILCVVDAEDLAAAPERAEDPLWRAQVQAADYVILSKTARAEPDGLARLRTRIAAEYRLKMFDVDADGLPLAVLFTGTPTARLPLPPGPVQNSDRFAALEWQSEGGLPFNGFQRLIETLAPVLWRAKGFLSLVEKPNQPLLFQMVGRRAGFEPAKGAPPGCRLVLIGEAGSFDPDAARAQLDALARPLTDGK